MKPIPLTGPRLIARLPQTAPFRFVDEVLEVDAAHIVGRYTFRADEFFYAGHFPEQAVTPGVILLEAMAQCGLVLQGLHLLSQEVPPDELAGYRTMFTDAAVNWQTPAAPGEAIVIRGEVLAWRRLRLRSQVSISNTQGKLIASGELAGMGVRWQGV